MTIDIDYNKYTLFDIEYYMAKSETAKTEKAWYSELQTCVCVEGLARYLKDNLNKEGFNLDEFIRDSEQIQELRGWLWETHRNYMEDMETCSKRHYHEFKPELDEIIDTYCKKYGFYINVD